MGYKQKRVIKKGRKLEEGGLDCSNFRYLALLIRRSGNSRAFFYRTLDQNRLSSLNQRHQQQHQYYITSMKVKKKDRHKLDSSAHVGNKVLPVSDSTTSSSSWSSSSNADDQQQCRPSDQKMIKEKVKGENSNRTKTLSRMKELLRWAAASKSEKGGKFGRKVMHFRNRPGPIKSGAFDEEISNESPKISFRWEVESVSTTCSAPPSLKYDQFAHYHKAGNWITTDDEFVVLEL